MKQFEVVRGRSSIALQMEAAMATNSASFGMDFESDAPKKSGHGRGGGDGAAELLPRLRKGGYCNGLSEKELSRMQLTLKDLRGKADSEKDADDNGDADADANADADADADIVEAIDPHGFMNGTYLREKLAEVADTTDDDDSEDSYTNGEDDDEEEYDDEDCETETEHEGGGEIVSPALEFLRREGKAIDGPPSRIVFPTLGQVEGSDEFPLLRTPSTVSWDTFKEIGDPNTPPWPEEESPMTRKAEVQNDEMIKKGVNARDDDEETIHTEIILPQGETEEPVHAQLSEEETRTASVAMLDPLEADARGHEADITSRKPFRTMSRNNIRMNPKKGLSRAIGSLQTRKNGANKKAPGPEENEALMSPSAAREKRAPNLRRRLRMLGISRRFKKKNHAVPKTNKLGAPKTFIQNLAEINEEQEEQEGQEGKEVKELQAKKSSNNNSTTSINRSKEEPKMPDKQDVVSTSTPIEESNDDNEDKHLAAIAVTPVRVRVDNATATDPETPSKDRDSLADTPTTATTASSPSSWNSSSPRVRITVKTGNAGSVEWNNGRAGKSPPAIPGAKGGGLVMCRTAEEYADPAALASAAESGSDGSRTKAGNDPPGATSDVASDRDIFQIKNSYKLQSALLKRQYAIATEKKILTPIEKKSPAVDEKSPAVEEKPPGIETTTPIEKKSPAVDEKSPAVEEKPPGILTTKGSADDTADSTFDLNSVGDDNDEDDISEPSIRIVCDDCDYGVIGTSTDVFVEVSAHGACQDIEVINCMGLEGLAFENDHIESNRVNSRVGGADEEEAGEQELSPQSTKNTEETKKTRASEKTKAAMVPTSLQQQEPRKEVPKSPLVEKHIGRGRLGASKILDMMNLGNNNENNGRSKSQDPERTKDPSKRVESNGKKIGGRFRKKKQKAATNNRNVNDDNQMTIPTSINVYVEGSGTSAHTKRGLSDEARKELKSSWLKKAEDSGNIRTDRGLSSEARKALKKAEKKKLQKKKKKNIDEPTRKASEIFVPVVITPVVSPKLGNKKNLRCLSQEAQAALSGDEGIDVSRSRRRGHRGLSRKAKHILAEEDEDEEDFDTALEKIEISVGLNLPKNSSDGSEDEISMPEKPRSRRSRSRCNRRSQSRSVPRSDENCRRSRRDRHNGRHSRSSHRSRSALRYNGSNYNYDSEDGSDSYYESDRSYDSEDGGYISYGSSASKTSYSRYSQGEDNSYMSYGSSASKTSYSGYSQSENESDDASDRDDSRHDLAGCAQRGAANSPARKKAVKRSDRRNRLPRLPRSGKGSSDKKQDNRGVGKKKNLKEKKTKKGKKKKNEEPAIKEESSNMDADVRRQSNPPLPSSSGSNDRHNKKSKAKFKVTKESKSKKNSKGKKSKKKRGAKGKKKSN